MTYSDVHLDLLAMIVVKRVREIHMVQIAARVVAVRTEPAVTKPRDGVTVHPDTLDYRKSDEV